MKRILVVDDDADFCESLADVLVGAGYEVTTAATSAEALETARRIHPQVSVVDARLGRDSGTELVRLLQQELPGSLCVTMTAYAGVETAIRALRAGAYDYITKPFEMEDLFATLNRCFERISTRAALEEKNSELRQLNQKLRELVEAAGRLAAQPEEEGFGRALLAEQARILGAEGGSLYLFKGDSLKCAGCLDPGHAALLLPLPLRPGCLLERAFHTHQPLLLEDVAAENGVARSGWNGYQGGSAIVLPIVDERLGLFGILSLHDKRRPPFTAQDLDLGKVLVSLSLEVIGSLRARTALRESEALYREVFEKASDGLFVIEVTPEMRYRVVDFNPAQKRMLGLSGASVLGKYSDEYLSKEVYQVIDQQNRQAIASGTTSTFESAIELPSGQSYFSTTLVPVRDPAGRVHRLIGLARDMTESRRMVEALRQSEEKFSKAFHGSPDSIIISRLEDGVLLEVNRGFLEAYGYEREEAIGRASHEELGLWVNPEERTRLLAVLKEQGEVVDQWVLFRRRNGDIRYSLVSARIIEIEGAKRVLSIIRDMTEHKRMQEALRESEARFRLLAENSTDLISRHTPEGVYLYASPASAALLGYAPEQLLGRSAYEFFHPDDLTAIRRSHEAIKAQDLPYTVSYRIRRSNGDYTWFETVSRGLRDPQTGEVLELQCASRDISERVKALERDREHELQLFQAAKLASLGTLVSGVAHEINNPNNFIRLNSQNLEEFWKDIRIVLDSAAQADSTLRLKGIPYPASRGIVEDLLGGIVAGSTRIEKLVRNLQDFARGDEGSLDDLVGLNDVLSSGVMIVQNLIKNSTGSFSMQESKPLPPVRGNYHQLEQVVINLVTNACQALPSPDRKIAIRTKVEDEGRWVELVVADEGIGISPADLPRVTDPFFTTKRQKGGSGLGLAVSSRIVQNHGGTMRFQSEVGRGTVVTVRFPAARRAS